MTIEVLETTCSEMCQVGNFSATCSDIILWMSQHETKHAREPLTEARTVVASHCGVCGVCSVQDLIGLYMRPDEGRVFSLIDRMTVVALPLVVSGLAAVSFVAVLVACRSSRCLSHRIVDVAQEELEPFAREDTDSFLIHMLAHTMDSAHQAV